MKWTTPFSIFHNKYWSNNGQWNITWSWKCLSWNENIDYFQIFSFLILVGITWLLVHHPWSKLEQFVFLFKKSQTKYKNDKQRNMFNCSRISMFSSLGHYSRTCLTTFKNLLFWKVSKMIMVSFDVPTTINPSF